jgi:hypothetical protein
VCRDPAGNAGVGGCGALDSTFIRSCGDGERHREVRVGNVETKAGGRQVFGAVAKADTAIEALIGREVEAVGRTEGLVLTVFSDGCPGLRRILADSGVTELPILDWFYIGMRLPHLKENVFLWASCSGTTMAPFAPVLVDCLPGAAQAANGIANTMARLFGPGGYLIGRGWLSEPPPKRPFPEIAAAGMQKRTRNGEEGTQGQRTLSLPKCPFPHRQRLCLSMAGGRSDCQQTEDHGDQEIDAKHDGRCVDRRDIKPQDLPPGYIGQHEHAENEHDRRKPKRRSHPLPLQHMPNPEDFRLGGDLDQVSGAHSGVPGEQPRSRLEKQAGA